MAATKSIIGTMKTDWKARVLFYSMMVCGLLIVCSIILAMRMI